MSTSPTPEPVHQPRRKNDPLNPEPFRIVAVDAEECILELIEFAIPAKYDVALKLFTSSRAAWKELEQTDPDLLITDCMMHHLSGEQIVRGLMLRKVSYPILVISGFLSENYVLGWFPEAPNISFLKKPFSLDQFCATLDKHFAPMPVGT